jgi:hypothetical protein
MRRLEVKAPLAGGEVWVNDRYVVLWRPEHDQGWGWLSIRTHTRSARHDWREFQRIKDEVAGPEREAVELYPRASRIVDTANQFHLFVLPEGKQLGVGFDAGHPLLLGGQDDVDEETIRAAAASVGLDPDEAVRNRGRAKQRPRRW